MKFNNYYVIGAGLFLILFFFTGSCFCCREQIKYKCLHNIRTIPGSVRRKFKLFKKKDLLPRLNCKKSIITKGKKVGKSLMRFVRKPHQKLMKPTIPFEIIHGKMGPHHIKLTN
uniref:Uncharacterized protein n=2 Tax=Sipha flava TaxID=143950 RepID=A0A2S2QJA2_9HEMI